MFVQNLPTLYEASYSTNCCLGSALLLARDLIVGSYSLNFLIKNFRLRLEEESRLCWLPFQILEQEL